MWIKKSEWKALLDRVDNLEKMCQEEKQKTWGDIYALNDNIKEILSKVNHELAFGDYE